MTDREQAESAVARTVAELGRLDIVINNAGVMLLGPIADAPVEEWEQMVQVNVLGLLYIAKGRCRTSWPPPNRIPGRSATW